MEPGVAIQTTEYINANKTVSSMFKTREDYLQVRNSANKFESQNHDQLTTAIESFVHAIFVLVRLVALNWVKKLL